MGNKKNCEVLPNHKEISDLANILYCKQDKFNLSNPYEVGYVIINILGYQKSKETAKKLIRLIEFHSISKRDESGYETFTISNLCLREILREEFGFTNEELETIWEIDKGENK